MAKRTDEQQAQMQAHVDACLAHMAGGQSLRSYARKSNVAEKTLREWIDAADPTQYARARASQADALFDEIGEVAREAIGALSSERVQAARLLVDTLKWQASKILPKRYGDRVELDHGGQVRYVVEVPAKAESATEWARAQRPGSAA